MEEKLKCLSEKWKSLPRNNAVEMVAADDFYQQYIMPLAAAKFVEDFGTEEKCYDLMLVTVGTSWQPVALSVLAKKPKQVIMFCTPDVMDQVERAIDFMASCGYEPDYKVEFINKADSVPLMKAIQQYYLQQKSLKVCMDITGGTKAMAASAAMMAARLGIELYYVESKYLPVYRRPEPGSERLVRLLLPQECCKKG